MKVCPHCGGAYPVEEGFCPMDGTRLRTLHATTMGAGGTPVQPANARANELIGTVLDRRYRLDALIGEGGMGLVFAATHVLIGKPLAVKVLRKEHIEAPDVARRFLLEARVASSLKHPNVVEISDFGEMEGGGAYYVMELLEGRTLAQHIDQQGAMAPADAIVVATQICAGLSAAHALGVVHRDLKPDNVFLANPRHGAEHPLVKLLDFGIARAGPRRITVMGAVLGTPEYMSPEMAQGHDVDHRADLYALGVMLFEMLTGTVPFYDKEMAKTLELHVFAQRPTLASRKPELARLVQIGELVGSLMAIDREQRPSGAEVAMRTLRLACMHDLGADAAAVVQRATLAIGSGRMPGDTQDPARPQWPAASQWPTGQTGATASDPASAGREPSPEPKSPTYVLPPPRGKPSQVRPALIALCTAAVACVVTLGIAKWMSAPSASAADVGEAVPAARETTAAQELPAVARPPEAADPPAAPAIVPPPADTTAAPAPTPVRPAPDVIPIAAGPSHDDEKSTASVDRSKGKRRRVSEPTAETSGGTSPSPTAPATTDGPSPASDKRPADPPAGPTKRPADLKDPFPGK